jgi:PAS domain-containing protein
LNIQGKSFGRLWIHVDITERKRAEAELRRKEEELREVQRVAHIGNWYWDAQTDATTGSDELLRIYGLDPQP